MPDPRMPPIVTIAILAVGLSMDAAAVSLSAGLARPAEGWARMLRMPLVFGLFQALMPGLGWLGGAALRGWVPDWAARSLAAILLAGIGGKMLWELRHGGDERRSGDPYAWRPLLVLGLATSIDALAAGTTLALVRLPPALSMLIIGLVTAALCVPAVLLGRRLGCRWAGRAELLGGLTLLAIAVKVLVAPG